MAAYKFFTEEEKKVISELYPLADVSAQEIADKLGRPVQSIYYIARKMRIDKDASYRYRGGLNAQKSIAVQRNRFQPGHIPANKGKKMSPEQRAKCQHTFFKPGREANNRRPVGSERLDTDGYYIVKVAEPNVWVAKHRVLWERHHGPIPPGMIISFKDGNRRNLSLNNLELISREQHMHNQRMVNIYPPDVVEVIRLRGALKRRINNLKQKNNEQ